jgi:ligand-binding sensor domain-containing protein/signal transduction histidine kinase
VINGLASNSVNKTVQDKDGYIWLATSNGLQRYDGTSFITFKNKASDPASIPSNHIVLAFIDRNKNLWIMGDNDKIGIFDTRKFVFHEVPVTGQKRKLFINQGFLELHSGELVMMKDDGDFIKYDPASNQFVQAPQALPFPLGWKRRWIKWDPLINKYWIAADSGLVQYDPASRHLNYRNHNIDNDPVIAAFKDQTRTERVFSDVRGNVIFVFWPLNAGGPTLYRYNRKKSATETLYTGFNGYHEIGYFLQQRNGRLWIYGHPFFAEWQDFNGESSFIHVPNGFTHEHSIHFDYMHDVFEDRENNIWLASDNGVFLFNPDAQIFSTYNIVRPGMPATEGMVQAMEELKDGRIFVGCWGSGGLTCYDRNFNPLPLPDKFPKGEISIWDMAINAKTNDLWITLQGGSIVIFNPKTNKFSKISPEIFGGATIRQVDEDTSGNLWFGTHNGKVMKWDYKKANNDPTKGYELILNTGMVHKIHYDYQGYIWVATLQHGLLRIDAKTHKVVKTFSTLSREGERLFMDSPGDMTYYNDSTLIVSAGCLNIINTRTNKVSFITTEDGLPSHTTESVEKDENGIVWIGMTNGICRLNLERKVLSFYDRRDGIVYDKFEMAGAKELSDGKLAFFTDHNFLVFNPRKFGQEYMPPRTYITAFKLGGQSLSTDSILHEKRAVLKYNNTSISISFSALTYLQQQKVHYYYMLENLDDEWIRIDRPVEVTYNYLPPGNYTFKVKSENADGIMNPDITALAIVVRPPVWKTWWFFSLIALLIIGILYLLDKERMKRRKSLLQVRSQIATNLTSEVSATLNNINVLSEIAKIKADKNIEQSKDFIDQISDKSRYMIEAMDDTLWSIDPKNDSMKQTILRIKELTDGIRAAYGVEIDLIVDNKVQSLELDMKIRHEFYFFYKESMNFIVKNLHCRQAFVNINRVRSRLMIEILSECNEVMTGCETSFRQEIMKRVKALPSSIDVIADHKSFSVILYVEVK